VKEAGFVAAEIFPVRQWAEPIDTVLKACVERHGTVV